MMHIVLRNANAIMQTAPSDSISVYVRIERDCFETETVASTFNHSVCTKDP